MNVKDFQEHVKCIMSMCTDYLMGRTNATLLISNLKLIIKKMESE